MLTADSRRNVRRASRALNPERFFEAQQDRNPFVFDPHEYLTEPDIQGMVDYFRARGFMSGLARVDLAIQMSTLDLENRLPRDVVEETVDAEIKNRGIYQPTGLRFVSIFSPEKLVELEKEDPNVLSWSTWQETLLEFYETGKRSELYDAAFDLLPLFPEHQKDFPLDFEGAKEQMEQMFFRSVDTHRALPTVPPLQPGEDVMSNFVALREKRTQWHRVASDIQSSIQLASALTIFHPERKREIQSFVHTQERGYAIDVLQTY